MSFEFLFTRQAEKQFSKLDKPIQRQIFAYIEKNIAVENPRVQGKPMQGSKSQYWRYRIGKYRLIVDIQDDKMIVIGIGVGKRGDIYKR